MVAHTVPAKGGPRVGNLSRALPHSFFPHSLSEDYYADQTT